MSDHQRQVIRKAVVAQLVAAQTAAADRVFPTREAPWRRIELPGISVYSLDETSERTDSDGGLDRHVSLAIYGVVQVSDQLDDKLDALSLEIENAIRGDPTFGGAAVDASLTATAIGPDEQQGRPVGAVHLAYDVRYLTE